MSCPRILLHSRTSCPSSTRITDIIPQTLTDIRHHNIFPLPFPRAHRTISLMRQVTIYRVTIKYTASCPCSNPWLHFSAPTCTTCSNIRYPFIIRLITLGCQHSIDQTNIKAVMTRGQPRACFARAPPRMANNHFRGRAIRAPEICAYPEIPTRPRCNQAAWIAHPHLNSATTT